MNMREKKYAEKNLVLGTNATFEVRTKTVVNLPFTR